LRWFVELFDERGLVGAHPGVTLTAPIDSHNTIGEADVLLLFADGALVPIEIKRRISGADAKAAGLMDTVAAAVDAPWDALVVTQPAREIPTLPEAMRSVPERPRLVLTDDQLHADLVLWTMGGNPFAWEPRAVEEDEEREAEFTQRLAENDPDVPWDSVTSALLGRDE